MSRLRLLRPWRLSPSSTLMRRSSATLCRSVGVPSGVRVTSWARTWCARHAARPPATSTGAGCVASQWSTALSASRTVRACCRAVGSSQSKSRAACRLEPLIERRADLVGHCRRLRPAAARSRPPPCAGRGPANYRYLRPPRAHSGLLSALPAPWRAPKAPLAAATSTVRSKRRRSICWAIRVGERHPGAPC